MSLLSCKSSIKSQQPLGVPDRGSECFENQEVAFEYFLELQALACRSMKSRS
jgi:hypothetical protein